MKEAINDATENGLTRAKKVFEFDATKGVETKLISLPDLRESIRRETGLAGIRGIPAQYWMINTMIAEMLTQNNVNFDTSGNHFVQNNSSKAYLTDTDRNAGYTQKSAPLEKWRFDKILGYFDIPNVVAGSGRTDLYRNCRIATTLNKEGLVIAFGQNVHVCSNFNVMGGTVIRSYGEDRGHMPIDYIISKVEKWVKGLDQLWKLQNSIVDQMVETAINPGSNVVEELIGDLYFGAIKQAYFKGNVTPFNTNELSDFVQTIIKDKRDKDQLNNLWDIYNWGTSIMKPDMVDIGEIANNSLIWSDYLLNKFDLTKTIETIEILN